MAREQKRTIRYDDDVWELLEGHAQETGRPITAIVNEAIREYLGEVEPTVKARLSTVETRLAAIEARLGLAAE